MILIGFINALVVVALVVTTLTKGFERALPLSAFFMLLFPIETQIPLPGLFDLTTQRLVVICLIVLYVLFGKVRREGAPKIAVPMKHLVLLLIVWMFISAANSVVLTVSVKTVLSQITDFFIPYYIAVRAISKAETVHKILFAFIAAMFVCSVFGVLQTYADVNLVDLLPRVQRRIGGLGNLADAERGVRLQTTFGHPILYGAALAMAIPIALYLLTAIKTQAKRAFLWVAVMLMFLNIYKTGSRGPWLALAVALGILIMFAGGRLRKYVTIIALLAATVLIVRPGVWQTLANIYYSSLNPETPAGESYEYRYALYRVAYETLAQDPGRSVWGYGPESFFFLNLYAEFQGTMEVFRSCDSSFAQVWIEMGYVGLLLVLILLLRVGYVALRNVRRLPAPSKYLAIALLTSIWVFYFEMVSVAIWSWGQQTYMFWMIVGIASIYPHLVAAESVEQEKAGVAPISLAPSLVGAQRLG